MKHIEKILNILILVIHKLTYKTKYIIKKISNKVILFKRKQAIIRNTYDPILKEKLRNKDELSNKLNELKTVDNNINKEISQIQKENINLQNKIDLLSDLIITGKS